MEYIYLKKEFLKTLSQKSWILIEKLFIINLRKKIFAKKYYNSFIDIGTKSDLKKAKNIVPRIIKKKVS